jgi:acetyl-CoA carboxylase carboxyltransferase component
MGGEQASGVLITLRNDQRAKEGLPPMSREEEDEIRNPLVEAARKESNAYYSTANLWDDGIIDPMHTRDVLGLAISASLNAPIRDDVFGYGVFRM